MLNFIKMKNLYCFYILGCILAPWIMGTSMVIAKRPKPPPGPVVTGGGGYSVTYKYDEEENLSASLQGINVELGRGEISGTFTVEWDQSNAVCLYFRLIATPITAKVSYPGFSLTNDLGSFTTPWCQYTGYDIGCPIYSLPAFNVNIPYVCNTNNVITFVLAIAATSGIPSVVVKWDLAGDVTASTPSYKVNPCAPVADCSYTVPAASISGDVKATIVFPIADISGTATATALDYAKKAPGCNPPPD